jgi:hypothetical protein
MRNHASHLAVAILTAAVGVACTGRTDGVDNDRRAQGGGERGINQRLSLEGCVEAAAGANEYVLRNVTQVPPAQQPQGGDRMEPLVARGSWVRLASGDDELKKYLGKRVTLMGEVRDAGGNTIGTAGQSSAAPRAGEANGNAPLIAVEQVKEKENDSGLCGQQLPGDSSRPTGK